MKREYSKTPNGALERWSVGALQPTYLFIHFKLICL